MLFIREVPELQRQPLHQLIHLQVQVPACRAQLLQAPEALQTIPARLLPQHRLQSQVQPLSLQSNPPRAVKLHVKAPKLSPVQHLPATRQSHLWSLVPEVLVLAALENSDE